MERKIAIPFILCILAIPLVMVVTHRHKDSYHSLTLRRAKSSKAHISYEPITLENEETWEIVTDPTTGIPLKVIGHRKVSYG